MRKLIEKYFFPKISNEIINIEKNDIFNIFKNYFKIVINWLSISNKSRYISINIQYGTASQILASFFNIT